MDVRCSSIEEVRQRIDRLDHELVTLLARRGRIVAQAATFKKTTNDVRAPSRVEEVIVKVRAIASETGASPELVERVYRAMIAAFIDEELKVHAELNMDRSTPRTAG